MEVERDVNLDISRKKTVDEIMKSLKETSVLF
jgi:hypothetical protein